VFSYTVILAKHKCSGCSCCSLKACTRGCKKNLVSIASNKNKKCTYNIATSAKRIHNTSPDVCGIPLKSHLFLDYETFMEKKVMRRGIHSASDSVILSLRVYSGVYLLQ
jgi:hypothetical protein